MFAAIGDAQDELARRGSAITRIDFTGHSLGGGQAQYFAYDAQSRLADLNIQGVQIGLATFNAFGSVEGIVPNATAPTTPPASPTPTSTTPSSRATATPIVSRIGALGHVGGNTHAYDVGPGYGSLLEAHDVLKFGGHVDFQSLPAATPTTSRSPSAAPSPPSSQPSSCPRTIPRPRPRLA
ncbi:MAG: hypothetical protein MZW92_01625 [Comamonadaceae bacterium]|nr:hypothetical protein [Comamonadaceae bacterium]